MAKVLCPLIFPAEAFKEIAFIVIADSCFFLLDVYVENVVEGIFCAAVDF